MKLSRGKIDFEDASSFLSILNGFHDRKLVFNQLDSNTLLLCGDDIEYEHHEIEIRTKDDLFDSVEIYYEKSGRKLSIRKETRKNEKLLSILNCDESFNVCVSKDSLYIYSAIYKGNRYSKYDKIVILKEVDSMFVRC